MRIVFALIAMVLTLWARAAYADTVIVATPANDPIAARVEDELEALGFQVVETIVESDATVESILIGREYARAVVLVRPPGAEVWIVNPDPVLRESISSKTVTQVALRAVEVVRGSLLKLPEPPPKPVAKPPPKLPPPPPPPLRSRSFELAIGPALAAISPGVAAQLGGRVGAFDLDGFFAYAPLRRTVTEPEGTARLAWGVAAARLRYRIEAGTTAFHLGLGAGVAAGFATAAATAAFESSSATLLSPAAIASASLKARLIGSFDLWLDLSGVLTRGMVLRVLDRDVARVSFTTLLAGGVGVSFR